MTKSLRIPSLARWHPFISQGSLRIVSLASCFPFIPRVTILEHEDMEVGGSHLPLTLDCQLAHVAHNGGHGRTVCAPGERKQEA